jgi:xylan 1,4-beta-xylosidase
VWIKDFLKYCEKENLPVDFISTHPYPTDYALDPEEGRSKSSIRYLNSLHDDIEWLQNVLANSKYPSAEIHLTEWSTSPNSRDRMHDRLPAAAYIIRANLDCIGMVQSLMYWTFTDVFEEKGGAENLFHGGFGLINFQGIHKPTYHAYRMLHQLGDRLLHYDGTIAVSRCSDTGKIVALAFNYPVEYESHVPSAEDCNKYMNASPKHVNLVISNLNPNTLFEVEMLDNNHGDVLTAMQSLSLSASPNREEIELLKSLSNNTIKRVICSDADGNLTIDEDLQPWAFALIKQI